MSADPLIAGATAFIVARAAGATTPCAAMAAGATLDAVQVAGVVARVMASAEVRVENVAVAGGATTEPPREMTGLTD